MNKRSGDAPTSLLAPLTGYHYEFEIDCSLEAYVEALRDKIAGIPVMAIKFQNEDQDSYQFVVQYGGPSRTATGYLKAISAGETLVSGKMGRDRFSIFVILIVAGVLILQEFTSGQPVSSSNLTFAVGFCFVLYLLMIAGYRRWTRLVQKALRLAC